MGAEGGGLYVSGNHLESTASPMHREVRGASSVSETALDADQGLRSKSRCHCLPL